MKNNNNLIPVDKSDTYLTEDLECPFCAGHMKLDLSYLEQITREVNCPYCEKKVVVGDDVYDEGCRPEEDPIPTIEDM